MKNKWIFTILIFALIHSLWAEDAAARSFITNNGTQIDNFDDSSAWILGGTGASIENDTNNLKEGTQGIKITTTNGNVAWITKTIDHNFSNASNFAFDVYLVNSSNISNIAINIGSTTDFTKYYVSTTDSLVEGRNKIVIAKSSFTDTKHKDSWGKNMLRIRIRVNMVSEGSASATFDDLRYDVDGKPKVIITFDDGFQSVYDNAYPIMQNNGQNGVSFVITSYPDKFRDREYMDLIDITKLYNAGWDISSHTVSHSRLTAISQTSLENELNDSYDWLMTHNFNKSAIFLAYPYGKYNYNVITSAKRKGYVFGKTTINGQRQAFFSTDDEYVNFQLKTMNIVNTTSVDTIKTYINDTIEQKSVLILTFHQIVNNSADTSIRYLTSDFQKISEFLKTKSDAGLLDVVTLSQYYESISNSSKFNLTESSRVQRYDELNKSLDNTHTMFIIILLSLLGLIFYLIGRKYGFV